MVKVTNESYEKKKQAYKKWLRNNFEKVFELRNKNSKVIEAKLNIPPAIGDVRIRRIRRDAIKEMTKRELRTNPTITLDELWEKWELERIPQWKAKVRVVTIRPYDVIFRKAKSEVKRESYE
jgi:hypothetical protein